MHKHLHSQRGIMEKKDNQQDNKNTFKKEGKAKTAAKKTVLIIEDQDAIAEAERIILQDQYNVHLASDGLEGLKKVRAIRPDAVVLDIMMPHVDGFEVCKQIREDPSLNHVKIVMVTSKNREHDEQKGMGIGADDYIMKPFEPVELLHVLQQMLG